MIQLSQAACDYSSVDCVLVRMDNLYWTVEDFLSQFLRFDSILPIDMTDPQDEGIEYFCADAAVTTIRLPD